jgi:hypothetical protein
VGGTAMGTRVAPSFANIFMAHFEKTFVDSYKPGPAIWLRYIDDIFFIWQHGLEKLLNFFIHLNNCHPNIKFTYEYGRENISFLDTSVSIDNDILITNLYTKPTDSHNYLLYSSSHPEHVKKGIPYSQFLRVRRICTHLKDYIVNASIIAKHFVRREYPVDLVFDSYLRAKNLHREDLLITKPSKKDTEDKVFVISTFQPSFQEPRKTIEENWPLLGTSSATKEVYEMKPTFGFRRNDNLRNILVRAKMTNTSQVLTKQPTTNICKTITCRYCPKLNKSGKITSHTTGRSYITKTNITCKSSNLIYCITCNICGLQYVGQTKLRLMDRFQGHFWKVTSKKLQDPIGRHFNSTNHSGISNFEIHIVDFIHTHPDSPKAKGLRDTVEKHWIHRLRTTAPFGLNSMD